MSMASSSNATVTLPWPWSGTSGSIHPIRQDSPVQNVDHGSPLDHGMSRPPVELGGLDAPPPRGTPTPSEDGTGGKASVLGKGPRGQLDNSEGWTFHPVHHDLEATLPVVEVSESHITLFCFDPIRPIIIVYCLPACRTQVCHCRRPKKASTASFIMLGNICLEREAGMEARIDVHYSIQHCCAPLKRWQGAGYG